jgi:hypothetical protein
MLSEKECEGFLNQAKAFYAEGQSDRYIILQLADKKVPDEDIDKIMKEVKSVRKYNLRQQGIKELLLGLSFMVAGVIIAYFIIDIGSLARFISFGLPMLGVFITVKGFFNIIGW